MTQPRIIPAPFATEPAAPDYKKYAHRVAKGITFPDEKPLTAYRIPCIVFWGKKRICATRVNDDLVIYALDDEKAIADAMVTTARVVPGKAIQEGTDDALFYFFDSLRRAADQHKEETRKSMQGETTK